MDHRSVIHIHVDLNINFAFSLRMLIIHIPTRDAVKSSVTTPPLSGLFFVCYKTLLSVSVSLSVSTVSVYVHWFR